MADLLITDVPDNVVAALEAHASQFGLTCVEYVRRFLVNDASHKSADVHVADFRCLCQAFDGMADDDLLKKAWD